jgi:hypothetical protein
MPNRLFGLLLLLLVAGCSSTEFWYDNADWLASRWAAGLVDPSEAQRAAWREPFRVALAEHRQQLLPEVVALLRALEIETERGLSAARLGCLLERADRLYQEHAQLAVALGPLVLDNLTPQQIGHLAEELAERNQDYADDYLDPDPARRERARLERYVERIERWTDDLPAAQLALVEQAVRAMPDVAGDWLAYRQEQQRRLLRLLEAGAGPAQLQGHLRAWWVDLDERPAQLVRDSARIRAAAVRLAVTLDQAFTAEQRARFVANVRELRQDLEGAAAGPVPIGLSRALLATCRADI